MNNINDNPTLDDDSSEEDELLDQPSSGDEIAHEEVLDGQTRTDEGDEPRRDRSAESRIARLTAEKNEERRKREDAERKLAERERVPMPSIDSNTQLTPQEVEARNLLKDKLHFADRDTIREEVAALENRLTMNSKHNRLEDMYSGEDGKPKYDRREVEDFMRARGDVFDPEVAYRELYREELLDFEIKKAMSGRKPKPYTVQPTVPGKGESGAITAEKIAEMQAKGKAVFLPWYTKNRDKILALSAEGNL